MYKIQNRCVENRESGERFLPTRSTLGSRIFVKYMMIVSNHVRIPLFLFGSGKSSFVLFLIDLVHSHSARF